MKSKNMIQWLTWTAQAMIIHLTLPLQVPKTPAEVDVRGQIANKAQETAGEHLATVKVGGGDPGGDPGGDH